VTINQPSNQPSRVYLSIGSNQNREHHVRSALDALADTFDTLTISSVFDSEAVGFDGSAFLNLVVGLDTDWSVAQLRDWCKTLEDSNGRRRDAPKFSSRTLDVDILTYDKLTGEHDGVDLPRAEILKNAFVLLPLAEIAPDEIHPLEGKTYAQLWKAYSKPQKLWAIEFKWRGEIISPRAVL